MSLPSKPKNEVVLSWHRMDPEQCLGFRGGKYTDVNHLLALGFALLATGLFYVVLIFLARATLLATMFLDRSSKLIPFLISILSAWSLAILALKWMKLRLQRKALFLDLVPSSHDFVLAPATAPGILSRMYACVEDPKHFVLLNRIERAMSNLKNIGRVSDMTEMLHAQSQNDEDHLESSYTIIRGFIWGIPVLGFIGTVLGLAKAMSGFGETLRAGTDVYQLTESLKQITGGLSTAFEATLLGLVSALTIQLTLTSLKKREEGFLDDCKEYCHANIVSRLRLIQIDDNIAAGEANR